MSDLTGGRASNGARTGGPVPVSSSAGAAGVRTPRDIMRDREERERRRQEEAARVEEQRNTRIQEQRKSVERRAAAMAGANTGANVAPGSMEPRNSGRASSQYSTDQSGRPFPVQQSGSERLSSSGKVASGAQYGEPTGRSAQDFTPLSSRSRGPSVSAQDQPRPAPPTSSTSRRAQPSTSQPRQQTAIEPPAMGTASSGTSQRGAPADAQFQQPTQRSNVSAFPHAFERWEQLSSHWEGLTSYWLRKLDQNQEDIVRNVPTALSMSRQITDLSAAGANLFHAVVELQRLRASSERKFQRWFFETRSENERSQEIRAQIEQQLTLERNARKDATESRAESETAAANARRELAEMRRELMISKEEARRAWEELGRRNQESLETAQSLKDGRVTVVSGVQVVPYFGGPSRTGSASQRPTTRDGGQSYGPASATGVPVGVMPGEDSAFYQDRPSPTDTDPFTEGTTHGRGQSLHHEPGIQSLAAGTYQPYPLGGTPGSASTGQTIIPGAGAVRPAGQNQRGIHKPQPPIPISAEEAQRFYQQEPSDTYVKSQRQMEERPQLPQDLAREHGDLYLTNVVAQNPMEASGVTSPSRHVHEETEPTYISEDEYDTEADARHEQDSASAYTGRFGGGDVVPSETPSAPATSAQAMETYTPTSHAPGVQEEASQDPPDYEGDGYDRWEGVQSTRHHHPTRLSDVLEEDEERSSKRTGD